MCQVVRISRRQLASNQLLQKLLSEVYFQMIRLCRTEFDLKILAEKNYLWNWTDFKKLFSIQHNKIRNHIFLTSVLSAGFLAEIMKISYNMKIFDFQLIEEKGFVNKN